MCVVGESDVEKAAILYTHTHTRVYLTFGVLQYCALFGRSYMCACEEIFDDESNCFFPRCYIIINYVLRFISGFIQPLLVVGLGFLV